MLHADAFQAIPFHLPSYSPGPDPRDSITLEAVLRFWRKRRRSCLLWLAIGLAAGVAYSIVTPGYYTASASVLLEDDAARSAGAPAATTDAAHSTYVETQIQVFQSDEVIGRVVDTKNLGDDAEFGAAAGGMRAALVRYLRNRLGLKAPAREPHYATILRVKQAVSVHRIGTSDVVEIQFTSRNAARSADFANAVIQSYIDGRAALLQSQRAETETHIRQVLMMLRDKAFPAGGAGSDASTDQGPRTRARFLEEQDTTEVYRAMYGRLLQRALGDVDAQFASRNIRVITPATPPFLAGSRLMVVVVFACAGGILGLVQALLREAVDDFLHTEDDLRRLEGVDRVASLAKSRLPVRRKDKTNQSGFQPVYMADSRIAYETMARLAVTLNDCGTHRGAVVFGLGSPTRGAGTSLLAAHLARVLSETGQRVLLIDANWKRKSAGQAPLSVCHGGKLDRWLGTVTLGPEALAVLMLRATRPVSELDASISIASAIEILRAEQDYIVVDFHSLAQTADFEAGLPNVDRVMLVAEAGRTRARDLRELLRRLPARKLGAVVLNKA